MKFKILSSRAPARGLFFLLAGLGLAFPPGVLAADTAAGKSSSRQVRLLALGDLPPTRVHELPDKSIVQTPYATGAVPPTTLYFRDGKKEVPVFVYVRQLSPVLNARADSPWQLHQKNPAAENGLSPYAQVEFPSEVNRVLVLLQPTGAPLRWDRPRVRVHSLDPNPTLVGGVRLINASGSPLRGVVAGGQFSLPVDGVVWIPADRIVTGKTLCRLETAVSGQTSVSVLEELLVPAASAITTLIVYPSRIVPGKNFNTYSFSEQTPVEKVASL